uniref:HD domain-containing protein n=1 Tax=Setaria digitata TaxID=48799 RepID=A0A915PS23_9BILA
MAENVGKRNHDMPPPPPYNLIYPGMPEDISDKLATVNCELKAENGLSGDTPLIIKAVDLAARRHRQQRRKDAVQTPYVNHPIGVAYILTNEGQITDMATVIAAILHDTVENTKTTDEEIRKIFGNEVANIVKECTVDKSMKREARMKYELEQASRLSHKARLVQMADKLYNIRDMERCTPLGWTKQHVKEYVLFAKDLLSRIRGIHRPLEAALDDIINKQIR